MYGFRLHRTTGLRAVLVSEEVEQDIGESIPGEPPLVAEEYNEESVLEFCNFLGSTSRKV